MKKSFEENSGPKQHFLCDVWAGMLAQYDPEGPNYCLTISKRLDLRIDSMRDWAGK